MNFSSNFCMLSLILLLSVSCGHPPADKAPEVVRVAMLGHLYGLYVRDQTRDGVSKLTREDTLAALALDLKQRNHDAVFFLGDITSLSETWEWELLDKHFGFLADKRHYVAGNHDYKNVDNFLAFGGLRHQAVVVGKTKVLVLDCKNVFEASDLNFIQSELADTHNYDHVFVVMHYLLVGRNKEAKPGEDPNTPYNGVSNWSRDVVPLLTGKVKWVFCGDLRRPEYLTTITSEFNKNGIRYVLNSFPFTGEGPMIYVEAEVSNGQLRLVPRAVPLDLNAKWYDRNTRSKNSF